MAKTLYRSNKDKMIGGVAGGLGEYFDIDPVILRVLFILLVFAWGASILFYILLWIIVPLNPRERFQYTQAESETEKGRKIREEEFNSEKRKTTFAGVLITIGVIWLFSNIFPGFDLSWIVPLGLIALGAYILYKDQTLTNNSKVNHE